jgi:hypothetical protein
MIVAIKVLFHRDSMLFFADRTVGTWLLRLECHVSLVLKGETGYSNKTASSEG